MWTIPTPGIANAGGVAGLCVIIRLAQGRNLRSPKHCKHRDTGPRQRRLAIRRPFKSSPAARRPACWSQANQSECRFTTPAGLRANGTSPIGRRLFTCGSGQQRDGGELAVNAGDIPAAGGDFKRRLEYHVCEHFPIGQTTAGGIRGTCWTTRRRTLAASAKILRTSSGSGILPWRRSADMWPLPVIDDTADDSLSVPGSLSLDFTRAFNQSFPADFKPGRWGLDGLISGSRLCMSIPTARFLSPMAAVRITNMSRTVDIAQVFVAAGRYVGTHRPYRRI